MSNRYWTSMLACCLLGGLCSSLAFGCQPAPPDDPVLATVADSALTVSGFQRDYVTYLARTGLQDDARIRDGFLQSQITTRLMVHEARAAGIAETPAYAAYQETVERKLLVEGFSDRLLLDTVVVAEAELQAEFVRQHTQLKARHLYARSRAAADALYARLQAGEAFEALARETFADSTLAANGGSVGYFSYGEMLPAFEETAYGLEIGEVSLPVRTAFGYSIIQLEDRFTKPLLTETEFATQRADLEAAVWDRKRRLVQAAYARRQAEALDLHLHPDAFDLLVAQVEGRGTVGDAEALGAWLAKPLVSYGPAEARRIWTVADFRDQAQHATERRRAAVQTADQLAAFIEGLVVREQMAAEARAAGLHRLPAFQAAVRRNMDDWVWTEAFEAVVAQAVVPEDTLRAHYEAYAAEYQEPLTVRVHEILVETKATADRLKAQLDAGAAFDALARVHSLRPGADAASGDLGYLRADQLGVLAEPVLAAAPGTVLGPIELAGRYVLLQVGDRQAPRPSTYSEARPLIQEALREAVELKHFRGHADTLRKRYPVVIHTETAQSFSLPNGRSS